MELIHLYNQLIEKRKMGHVYLLQKWLYFSLKNAITIICLMATSV